MRADYAKDKALMMQELDHYKLERDDIAERLESEKRMNQKMIQALKDGSESGDEKSQKKQMQEYEKLL